MPNKAYAILLDIENDTDGRLIFPIKNTGQGITYPGMPQFFGGTKNQGESDRDTIAREMSEESDGKITLQAGGLVLIHKANIQGFVYSFYIAQNFSGKLFLDTPLDNAEMAIIRSFFVQIGQEDTVEDLLFKFHIVPSKEFCESETYTAFDKAIKWSEIDNTLKST